MTVAGVAAGPARRPLRDRPRLAAEVAVAAAWALLLVHPLAVAAGVHAHERPTLGSWTVMAAAMMLPAAIPAAHHVAVNSLRWRRHRAVATYVGAYLAVWVAYGAVLVALPARPPLPVALAVAAAWQVSPWQARALRACHRTVPLPPTGRRATRAVLRFGGRNAAACVATCWALMLVMAAAPAATHLAWTLALGVAVAAQRVARRPRHAARVVGAGSAAAAAVALAGGTAAALVGAAVVLAAAAAVSPRTPRRRSAAGRAWPARRTRTR